MQEPEEPAQPQEHVVFPETAIKHLPGKWQEYLYEIKKEGQGVLKEVNESLTILNRIVSSYPTMASLRYIHHRLNSTKYDATMEWALENDMLTLAFVTTYVRLVQGGIGSGVSRKTLPPELRSVHDNIIELRNKRYAHNDSHESITGSLEIGFGGGNFIINAKSSMDFYVGGALEWEPLVVFLDGLMVSRLHAQLEKLKEKTGREWTFPSGPPPKWVLSDPDRSASVD